MNGSTLVRTRSAVLVILAVYTAIGVLLTSYRYLEDVSNSRGGTLLPRTIEEMTGVYTALVAIPIAIWASRRFPISRATWKTGVPAALLGAIVYSAIHTTLMWGSRVALFPLLGLGPYDYGIMLYRYPMEGSNDVVSFAFVTGFVYGWRALEAARHAQLAAVELQAKLAQAQLENLRLQLNPHFLFNTLNAISSVMYEDVGKADEMLAKLSDFLRVVLSSEGVHQVAIGDELDVERKYVDIMTTRLERRLALNVSVDAAARDAAVPFMILQPLLENCIRHGTPPEPAGLAIAIGVTRDGSSTVISVADDGLGYPPRNGAAGGGRGLGLVRSRLLHMYGDGAALSIAARATGGTEAVVRLPFSPAETAS